MHKHRVAFILAILTIPLGMAIGNPWLALGGLALATFVLVTAPKL